MSSRLDNSLRKPLSVTHFRDPLETLSNNLQDLLWTKLNKQGHWHFPLDDNITMNAEYIMFLRWLDLDDGVLMQRLAKGILSRQSNDGSWNLHYNGPGNLSTSIEAYFALRLAGYPANHSALVKAKDYILSQGGIRQARVFTKIWLAHFGLYPFEGIPMIPPEIMLAPRGLPFHILEFSYWSRVTIVPLTILFHLQKIKSLDFDVDELFLSPSDKVATDYLEAQEADHSWIIKTSKWDWPFINWEQVFKALSLGVAVYESKIPLKPLRAFCVERAKQWILSHQEESGDWGGIQPPMLNSIMALHALGMPLTATPIQKGLAALNRFTRGISDSIEVLESAENSDIAILQSCVSPIWDSALGALGMLESGVSPNDTRLQTIKTFLWESRSTLKGDWFTKAKIKKNTPTAAWSFQYFNSQYPDIDDTCVVTMVLHRLGMTTKELQPALAWMMGMQGSDGGFGTFDRDNNQTILNRIPFADMKSLIDPSNPDVTGHVLECFAELGLSHSLPVRRAVRYLKRVQRPDGSWFGRWGVNLIYGTSAALVGLRSVGEPAQAPYLQRALKFLLLRQNDDGGWGEGCDSYIPNTQISRWNSTPSQTAWALLGLSIFPLDETTLSAMMRGVNYLESRWTDNGLSEPEFTGTGFPQHFYLRYEGYRHYFPLIATGRLKRILETDSKSRRDRL